jgi:hypothetical protein
MLAECLGIILKWERGQGNQKFAAIYRDAEKNTALKKELGKEK